jgi:DNA-binding MarR family transcriptional regulator
MDDQGPNPVMDLAARLIQSLKLIEENIKNNKGFPADVNFVSGLILARLARLRDPYVRSTDLRRLWLYAGSNASYNLTKLRESGYIEAKQSEIDGRAVINNLTQKGLEAGERIAEALDTIENEIGHIYPLESFRELDRYFVE